MPNLPQSDERMGERNGNGSSGGNAGGMGSRSGMDGCSRMGNCHYAAHFERGPVQLASVYSPIQKWQMLYPIEKALSHGTLFEELYKPLEVSRNG